MFISTVISYAFPMQWNSIDPFISDGKLESNAPDFLIAIEGYFELTQNQYIWK